eukprot:39756_1
MYRLSKITSHLNTKPANSANTSILTESQRKFYADNGYLIIRNLLSQNNCDELNKRFNEFALKPSIRQNELLIMRDVALPPMKNKKKVKVKPIEITKITNPCRDEIYLKNHLRNPKMVKYVGELIGNDIRALNTMHINKPPDVGYLSSRHPLHQDVWYLPLTNHDNIIAAWTATEYCGRNNGGLCVIPGTHKAGLFIHEPPKGWTKVNYKYYGVEKKIYDKYASKRIHLEMYPGDTVFFHPLLIHGSGANLSNITRKAIVTHYLNSTKVGFIDFKKLSYKQQMPTYYEKGNVMKQGRSSGINLKKKRKYEITH